jgi:hypothetical protein
VQCPPLAIGVACVFGFGGGVVAFGDQVFDLVGEAGDLSDGVAGVDEAEQEVFCFFAIGLTEAAYAGGDGGGVAGRQLAGGQPFGDLGEAG